MMARRREMCFGKQFFIHHLSTSSVRWWKTFQPSHSKILKHGSRGATTLHNGKLLFLMYNVESSFRCWIWVGCRQDSCHVCAELSTFVEIYWTLSHVDNNNVGWWWFSHEKLFLCCCCVFSFYILSCVLCGRHDGGGTSLSLCLSCPGWISNLSENVNFIARALV